MYKNNKKTTTTTTTTTTLTTTIPTTHTTTTTAPTTVAINNGTIASHMLSTGIIPTIAPGATIATTTALHCTLPLDLQLAIRLATFPDRLQREEGQGPSRDQGQAQQDLGGFGQGQQGWFEDRPAGRGDTKNIQLQSIYDNTSRSHGYYVVCIEACCRYMFIDLDTSLCNGPFNDTSVAMATYYFVSITKYHYY